MPGRVATRLCCSVRRLAKSRVNGSRSTWTWWPDAPALVSSSAWIHARAAPTPRRGSSTAESTCRVPKPARRSTSPYRRRARTSPRRATISGSATGGPSGAPRPGARRRCRNPLGRATGRPEAGRHSGRAVAREAARHRHGPRRHGQRHRRVRQAGRVVGLQRHGRHRGHARRHAGRRLAACGEAGAPRERRHREEAPGGACHAHAVDYSRRGAIAPGG